jgi:hypothetical protein
MKINLYIERLILDGLPFTSLQGPQVRAAVELELVRLLTAYGLSNELRAGGAVLRVRAEDLQFGKESRPSGLGRSIAQSVHEGIGNQNRENTR